MSLEALIATALAEDLGEVGDITTNAIVEPTAKGHAYLLAKQALVLSGMEIIGPVFDALGGVKIKSHYKDGDALAKGAIAATFDGSLRTLLTGERTMLNLLMHLSGIATLTRQAVKALKGSKTRVIDTRKTTPGLRALEKKAVRDGGGFNHRFALFDGILIKDNHITAAGSISEAVKRARFAAHHLLKIECEVKNLGEVDEALKAGAEILLLDNMNDAALAAAVARIDGRARTEASGNMTVARLATVGKIGVDFVSMGALTHSAPAADLSMKIE